MVLERYRRVVAVITTGLSRFGRPESSSHQRKTNPGLHRSADEESGEWGKDVSAIGFAFAIERCLITIVRSVLARNVSLRESEFDLLSSAERAER